MSDVHAYISILIEEGDNSCLPLVVGLGGINNNQRYAVLSLYNNITTTSDDDNHSIIALRLAKYPIRIVPVLLRLLLEIQFGHLEDDGAAPPLLDVLPPA